ncbi:MAG: hypothetical protein ACOC1F_06525 [Myxococcota bacterium]
MIAQLTVGRARPSILECAEDPDYDGACDVNSTGRTASFYSGHTSMAFTSAGLTSTSSSTDTRWRMGASEHWR